MHHEATGELCANRLFEAVRRALEFFINRGLASGRLSGVFLFVWVVRVGTRVRVAMCPGHRRLNLVALREGRKDRYSLGRVGYGCGRKSRRRTSEVHVDYATGSGRGVWVLFPTLSTLVAHERFLLRSLYFLGDKSRESSPSHWTSLCSSNSFVRSSGVCINRRSS